SATAAPALHRHRRRRVRRCGRSVPRRRRRLRSRSEELSPAWPPPYRTFTVAISWPSGDITWVEQARHGSKEWMVRRISNGFSGSAIGVSISEASNAPILPLGSRGDPFHVVGTTHW